MLWVDFSNQYDVSNLNDQIQSCISALSAQPWIKWQMLDKNIQKKMIQNIEFLYSNDHIDKDHKFL